ncbi:alpha/beta fold hydrolase [Aquipuribacter nitratireducens]|uniref:Alpha/beta fold hydrolase n=1 Tax=Aquipuribacter nitratireducens TaxID=650104 RepID=A0ABW0GM01_9MICO
MSAEPTRPAGAAVPDVVPDVVALPGRDVHLAVRRTVPVGGPWALAVLVHGLASNARMWDACAAALARHGVASVAVDQREHGASATLPDAPRTAGTVDTPTAAGDVAALVGLLRSEHAFSGLPVVLAGQSWGGNVVLEAAARGVEGVAALALVDGGWLRFDGDEPFEQVWRRLAPPGWDGATWRDAEDRLATALADWGPHALPAVLANLTSEPPGDPDGRVRNVLPLASHERILRSMHAQDPRTLYPAVTVPVLLAPAGRQPSADRVAEAVAGLSHPLLRRYDDAHHDLHLQHPDRLAADLVDVLAAAGVRPPEHQEEPS